MPEITELEAMSLPAWKRERKQPLHGPVFVQPPRYGTTRPQPIRRGPWQKLTNIALAMFAATTMTLVATTPTHAAGGTTQNASQDSTCDAKRGPENTSLGALYYVREVMDDAISKYGEYKKGDSTALVRIELNNDYICWVPKEHQATLLFLTDNLLVWMLDILQAD